jgi:hypothetical protein
MYADLHMKSLILELYYTASAKCRYQSHLERGQTSSKIGTFGSKSVQHFQLEAILRVKSRGIAVPTPATSSQFPLSIAI